MPEGPEAAATEDVWPSASLQRGTAGPAAGQTASTAELSPRLWDVGVVVTPWQQVELSLLCTLPLAAGRMGCCDWQLSGGAQVIGSQR